MKLPKLNVLLVESNRFLVTVLQETLAIDFTVTIAANGIEAMDLLEKGASIDIMITDLKLPKFDGLQLIRLVRNSVRYQSLPILALADAGDSNARIRCLEHGADDCMTKPFNPLEIRAKIKALFRRSGQSFARTSTSSTSFYNLSARPGFK